MADADEDVIPRAGAGGADEVDLTDETQDFRFLTTISYVEFHSHESGSFRNNSS